MSGKIFIVGIGPGLKEHMSLRAIEVIKSADVIVGYKTYTKILAAFFNLNNIISSGMKKEADRCHEALRLAEEGNAIALVSSGDSGIYGMAGIMLEIAEQQKSSIEIEIVPGITSSIASASILGAPITHDYTVISLSDLLTDWDLIKKRLDYAAKGDFVLCLYNPKSKNRKTQIEEARNILLRSKDRNTPVGIVKNAMRDGQAVIITTLEKMLEHPIDMTTTIIIGNSKTFTISNRMITPRGYKL